GGQTSQERNLAIRQVASQSGLYSSGYEANRAVDGDPTGYIDDYSGTRFQPATVVAKNGNNLWWGVSLTKTSYVREIRIYKATEKTYAQSLGSFIITLYGANGDRVKTTDLLTPNNSSTIPLVVPINAIGQNIQIERKDVADYLYLAEVEVVAYKITPDKNTTASLTLTLKNQDGGVLSFSAGPFAEFILTLNLTRVHLKVADIREVAAIFENIPLESNKEYPVKYDLTTKDSVGRGKTYTVIAEVKNASGTIIGTQTTRITIP
ncbi:MAG: hypothetical protein G01um101417_642, partial [Parcubacteria group bacterium Gr01-1014_17]